VKVSHDFCEPSESLDFGWQSLNSNPTKTFTCRLVATVRSITVSKISKLVAILLIAVVVAAGAGYWLFSPKPPSETVNYTSAET
jgi:hypothetical protein